MCVHESSKGNFTKPQLKNRSLLTLLLFLPAWKRPDDNNVEYWSPSEHYWPLLLNHLPPPPWSLKGLHMFMAHACGMTMGSPYKSQRDHGVFQILLSEDSCWQNDSSHIYFGQKAGALSGKLIRHPFSPKPRNKKRECTQGREVLESTGNDFFLLWKT